MTEHNACGEPHPTEVGLTCERELCAVYHRAGDVIWPSTRELPGKSLNPQRMAGILTRTLDNKRKAEGN